MASKKFVIPDSKQVEELFSNVDDTGHANAKKAEKQRRHRKEKGTPREIDPLSETNPAGSDIEKAIRKTAMMFVLVILAVVVVAQVSCGVARRAATANLSEKVSYDTVYQALEGGVEWGDGFTQFPEDFKVIEANERTHRVEVSVVDTSSDNDMDCFAGSNIQASALSVNALLNPNIDVVVYHVNIHTNGKGKPQKSALFGFLKPTGEVKRFMTFVWSKHATEKGFNFTCSITGADPTLMQNLKDRVSMSLTENIFGQKSASEKAAAEKAAKEKKQEENSSSSESSDSTSFDDEATGSKSNKEVLSPSAQNSSSRKETQPSGR